MAGKARPLKDSVIKGDRVWAPQRDHGWLCARVLNINPDKSVDVDTEIGTLTIPPVDIKGQPIKLEMCGNHVDRLDINNLIDIDEMSEGAILHHTRNRFASNKIYTHVGSILLAVNPFQTLNIYDTSIMRRALDEVTPFPHVFQLGATGFFLTHLQPRPTQ